MARPKLETKFVLIGEDQLKKFLRELPKRAIKKALRQAVNAGATPVVRATRSLAPIESGLLKKSIKKKVKSYKTGNAIAIVGADRAVTGMYKNQKRVPANYWHLVLGGTRPHSLGKGSQLKRHDRNNKVVQHGAMHPGAKANNILAKAIAQVGIQVRVAMEDKMREVLAREAGKLAR